MSMRMVGTVLLVIGCLGVVVNLLVHTVPMFGHPPPPFSVQGLVVWGTIALLGGLLRHRTRSVAPIFRRSELMIGLLMLVIGGCPWLYTSYLIGGRPGNESAGLLGAFIFNCVGLPGLIITLVALKLKFKNHKEERPDA